MQCVFKTKNLFIPLLALLAGCASQTVTKESAKLNLILSSNRYLSIEPCGCSLGPTGGLVREAEFVKREKASSGDDVLVLSGGINFKPIVGAARVPTKQNILKAETLLKGMGLVGVQAVGLVAEDFYIGLDKMKSISSNAKFPLISTNLSAINPGDTFWEDSHLFEGKNYSAIVLSVAAATKEPLKGLQWQDPKSRIQEVLKKYPQNKNRLVILISTLPEKEVTALVKEVPEINVVVGSREPSTLSVSHLAKASVLTNSTQEGKRMSKIQFHFHEGLKGLYNAETGALYKTVLKNMIPNIESLERSLASANQSERAKIEKNLTELKNYVAAAQSIPLENGPDLAEYEDSLVDLTREFEPPADQPNPVVELIRAYKAKVRELSMLGDRR